MLDTGPAACTVGDTRRAAFRRIAGDSGDDTGMDRPVHKGRQDEKHRGAGQNESLHGDLSFLLEDASGDGRGFWQAPGSPLVLEEVP